MKYSILIFSLLLLSLQGCSQNNEQTNQLVISGELSTPVLEQTGKNLFLGATLLDGGYFDGIYSFVTISGNMLTYSGIFTISIPEAIYTREYVGNNGTEYIGFKDKNTDKVFNIHTRRISGADSMLSDKELCTVEYYDGYITKSEKIKNIQNRKIYVNYATLMVSAPDTEPFKVIDTQFCVVNNGILYTFSASNFTHEYMDNIIDSFTFLD